MSGRKRAQTNLGIEGPAQLSHPVEMSLGDPEQILPTSNPQERALRSPILDTKS